MVSLGLKSGLQYTVLFSEMVSPSVQNVCINCGVVNLMEQNRHLARSGLTPSLVVHFSDAVRELYLFCL